MADKIVKLARNEYKKVISDFNGYAQKMLRKNKKNLDALKKNPAMVKELHENMDMNIFKWTSILGCKLAHHTLECFGIDKEALLNNEVCPPKAFKTKKHLCLCYQTDIDYIKIIDSQYKIPSGPFAPHAFISR